MLTLVDLPRELYTSVKLVKKTWLDRTLRESPSSMPVYLRHEPGGVTGLAENCAPLERLLVRALTALLSSGSTIRMLKPLFIGGAVHPIRCTHVSVVRGIWR